MIVSNLCDSIEHAEVGLETTFHHWEHSNIACDKTICETNTKLAVSNLGVYSAIAQCTPAPTNQPKLDFQQKTTAEMNILVGLYVSPYNLSSVAQWRAHPGGTCLSRTWKLL